MLHGIKLATVMVAIGGSLALSGCADTIYPRLPGLGSSSKSNTSLLSASEQQKTIEDLTAERTSHGASAAKEIERRE